MKKYYCPFCDYVYSPRKGDSLNNIPPNTSFEHLLDTWVCPNCRAGKHTFTNQEREKMESGIKSGNIRPEGKQVLFHDRRMKKAG